jgi:hypothetical protein
MATLLEILAVDLEEWPEDVESLSQSQMDSEIYGYIETYLMPRLYASKRHDEAIDYPFVTQAQWAAARRAARLNRILSNHSCAPQQFNATSLRDRIREIDITVEALEEERVAAVQALANEGLQLLPIAAAVDLQDWRNWQHGDLVVCVDEECDPSELTLSRIYTIIESGGRTYITDDEGDRMRSCIMEGCFKFHSRP